MREPLDRAIAELGDGARVWSRLSVDQRAKLLDRVRAAVGTVADEWVDAASASKGLGPGHPLRGEEWMSGPYAALGALDGYIATLTALAEGRSPLDRVGLGVAPGGRTRVKAFPTVGMDRILLSGFSGELWLEPGVSADEARAEAGLGQRTPGEEAGVGLVLGAGNITSIPFLDVLYELLAFNRVSILKVNPTQDAVVPVFERALAPLIELGFVRIVRGGGDVGAYLTQHPGIGHVHITGSAVTFDAIVWGTGEEAATRKAAGTPKLTVPITAELGGVAPIIVVPGAWTEADLRFQAQHIVTMRLHNSGHNCIAGQVVIVSRDWPQRDRFLSELRKAYAAAPERPVWYPRADEKLQAAEEAYPDAQRLGDGTRLLVEITGTEDPTAVETTEYFAPVLGVVTLSGTGQEFLDTAVAHANDELTGTLGANVLIDPATEAALGSGFEKAIADLRYGGIAINAWTGVVFATPILSWGAFPGATLEDVQSGLGVVHNTLLVDRVERSVMRGPFRPFPRGAAGFLQPRGLAQGTILPKPPYFVDSRTNTEVAAGLTRWHIGHSVPGLVATLTKAMKS
ncbi:aldehyde dehydrogenase [Microbacterium mangrovi]|uniref:Aldehyde dehydrogenase n=1 Tax=Microbacterium mangrovi TaxID=1348253 RepID=A0A0B2A1A8_9MICO|nr:aldehyde dehydrogenase [Microbacterium mangrovi]